MMLEKGLLGAHTVVLHCMMHKEVYALHMQCIFYDGWVVPVVKYVSLCFFCRHLNHLFADAPKK